MREDVPLPGQAIHVLGRQDLSRPVRRRQTLIDYLRRHGRAFEGTARAAGQLRADVADDQSSPEGRRTSRRCSRRGRGGAQGGAGYRAGPHAAGMVAGTCLSRRRAPPRRGSKYVRSGTKSEREVLSGCHRGFFLADPELSSSWRTFVQGVRQSHHFLPDPPFLSAKSAPICCRPSGESSGLSWEKDRRRVVVQSGPSSGRKAGVKYRPSRPMATW